MALSTTGTGKGGGSLSVIKKTVNLSLIMSITFSYNFSYLDMKYQIELKTLILLFCILFFFRKSKKTSPLYRVILHDDDYHTVDFVIQKLMKFIPGMTRENADNIARDVHYKGSADVIVCAQADAEGYCMQLKGTGLGSTIEPASGWR
ncbi:hypothetical protein MANES_11G040408v8 [Manihot esculenta]|uniref:Uncharacterized protein n=1 Tax=Manihot esculenta TaxID=3983 RepID=A0ACB7GTA2_MANES|nr:hypothetical protein MANES_11G040408v8 [Manihot esculenta]